MRRKLESPLAGISRLINRWGLIVFIISSAIAVGLGRLQNVLIVFLLLVAMLALFRAGGRIGLLCAWALFLWSTSPNPVSRFTGPLLNDAGLPEVVIYVGFAVWIAYRIVNRHSLDQVRSPYLRLLCLYLFFGLVAFLINGTPDQAIAWRLFRQACMAPVLVYVLVTQMIKTPQEAARVAMFLLLGGLLISLLPITTFRQVAPPGAPAPEILADRLTASYDLGPLGIIPIHLNSGAFLLALYLVVGLSLCMSNVKRWQALLGILVVVVSSVGVIGMATRTVWIAMFVAVPLVIWLSMRYSGLGGRRLVVLFAMVLGVAGLTLLRGAISSEVSGRWQSMLSIETMTSDVNYIGRVRIVEFSLDILKHNPMGTGFFYILPAAQDAIHTMYAEVALGTGIGGLIAYLLFLGLCLVYCWKSLRFAHSDYAWIIISGVVVIVALFVGGAGIAPAKRFSVNILHWFIVSLAMAAAQASQRPAKVS